MIEQNLLNCDLSEILSKIQNDLSSGLLYTHTRINDNTKRTLEAASFLYALIELLNEKGLISIEELDERKKQVAERLVKKFVERGVGLMYQDPEYDKYTFEHEAQVDCQSRLHICKAVCCKFPFAIFHLTPPKVIRLYCKPNLSVCPLFRGKIIYLENLREKVRK